MAGDGVSRYSSNYPGVEFVDLAISREARLKADFQAAIALYKVCLKLKPDIVHSIMPKAGALAAVAAYAARVPIRMHTFTGQVWDTKNGLARWAYRLVDKIIVKLNTSCLTDSASQSEHLFKEGISIEGQPLPVLGKGSLVGVDLERFDPNRIKRISKVTRRTLGASEDDFIVSFIARKTRDKGAFDMLEGFLAARGLTSNLKLLFIGPDESRGELDRLRTERPALFDAIIERGTVDNHEDYLMISDVLCVPSYREGFGTVVIDAGALAVPAIGSRIKGLVDSIADGESGLLFEKGDTAGMAQLIRKLAGNRKLAADFGLASRSRVEKYFSSDIINKQLKECYFATLRKSRVDLENNKNNDP